MSDAPPEPDRPSSRSAWTRAIGLLLFFLGLAFVASNDAVHGALSGLFAAAGGVIEDHPVLGTTLFIVFAGVLDMLDGRIARASNTGSRFGAELDSLVDVISFGMAPAALTFQWGLAPLGRLGWAVGFIYLAAAAVRLARFNIQRVADKRYFVGMPSPSAAGIPAATIFFGSSTCASAKSLL